MKTLPLRLTPGQDLRRALEAAVAAAGCSAAFVIAGIGSLGEVVIRWAGRDGAEPPLRGSFEIVALSGTVAGNGSHLHAALSDADGRVLGGHLGHGCTVRTTAEVLVALLPDWDFRREPDAATGFEELVIRRQPAEAAGRR